LTPKPWRRIPIDAREWTIASISPVAWRPADRSDADLRLSGRPRRGHQVGSPHAAVERSLGEVRRRVMVIGRFPCETSCLSLCCAVLDLMIAGACGLGLTASERQQLAQMRSTGSPRSLRS
jgi:putative transposase